jgi:MraZ protein
MFFGSYTHNLDDKGRLVIPSKMRDELGSKAYILKGFDGTLSIYKESDFQNLVVELKNLPFNKKNSRAYLRIQLASACELDIDRQGRALLPTQLLNKYQIGKEVIVIGALDHIEVWNRADYEEYEKNADSSFETIAEELSDKED